MKLGSVGVCWGGGQRSAAHVLGLCLWEMPAGCGMGGEGVKGPWGGLRRHLAPRGAGSGSAGTAAASRPSG